MRFQLSLMVGTLAAALSCSENSEEDAPGSVVISATTTGQDEDADGYVVTVDGGRSMGLESDGVVRFGSLAPGEHEVELQQVAPNCDATPSVTHLFRVNPGDTAQVRFFVTCYASGLTIRADVEGADPGSFYTIFLDGEQRPEQIEPGGSKTITGLSAGPHEIRLENLPFNCALSPSSQVVVVALRSITPVTFTSRCFAIAGRIEVVTATSGNDLDLDGYTLETDGKAREDISGNGITRLDLTGGTTEVRLTRVAKNCIVIDGDRRTVTITTGGPVQDTASITFAVQCHRLWKLALVRDHRLVLANEDGTIEDQGPSGSRPAWSPDGERLAWSCGSVCIADMNSGTTTSWTSILSLEAPAWNPDGTRIAYIAKDCSYYYYYYYGCTFSGLYQASPLGSGGFVLVSPGLVRVATDPAWSPDGSTIAFGCELSAGGPSQICTVMADGGSFRAVTPGGDLHPSWSPDGSRIVFSTSRFGGREIVTIRPDGTDLKRFNPIVSGWSPSWTPDGRIVFANGFGGISIINADGTGLIRLTRTVNDSLPTLRP